LGFFVTRYDNWPDTDKRLFRPGRNSSRLTSCQNSAQNCTERRPRTSARAEPDKARQLWAAFLLLDPPGQRQKKHTFPKN